MLLELVWQYNTKPIDSFYLPDSTCTTTLGVVQLRHVVSEIITLSGSQNEVFESWLSTANFMESNVKRFFFSFSVFDFYGLIINLYTKSFFTLEKAEIPT